MWIRLAPILQSSACFSHSDSEVTGIHPITPFSTSLSNYYMNNESILSNNSFLSTKAKQTSNLDSNFFSRK